VGNTATIAEKFRLDTWHTFANTYVIFTWWSKLSNSLENAPRRSRITLFTLVALLGISGRLWAQTKPSNFDFNVWLTASQSLLDGNNPYALAQFNYGPSWLGIVTGLQSVSSDTAQFRLFVEVFLIAIDLGIAYILIRKRYSLAGIVFFLSPIGIAISGQHQQIDNIAILTALVAVTIASRSKSDQLTRSDFIAALLIGLSLSIKHVFLLLPVWFLMRPNPIAKRLTFFVVPYVVFGLSLAIPFLSATETVMRTMVQYGGANNSPVLYFLLPDQLMPWIISVDGTKIFFAAALIFSGFLFRKVRLFEFTLIYTITAVVFSWSIVNQYLAVPIAAVAIWMNIGFLIWLILSSIYLWGEATTMNFPILNLIQPHTLFELDVVARDLFPYFLLGWLLIVGSRNKLPKQHES
jgi:hypothetical protein